MTGAPVVAVGRAVIRVAAAVGGTADRVGLLPAAAPGWLQPLNIKSAISNPIARSSRHRFMLRCLTNRLIVDAIVIQN